MEPFFSNLGEHAGGNIRIAAISTYQIDVAQPSY